jgi:hypothetical protein
LALKEVFIPGKPFQIDSGTMVKAHLQVTKTFFVVKNASIFGIVMIFTHHLSAE